MAKVADRNSWNNQPLPGRRARLDVRRRFSDEEYACLAQGLIPADMEDKWFIFMENDVLYFHRSWTGICVYEVYFDGRGVIREVWVNRDDDQYKVTDDDYDGKLVLSLIDNLLLGRHTAFPELGVTPGRPSD